MTIIYIVIYTGQTMSVQLISVLEEKYLHTVVVHLTIKRMKTVKIHKTTPKLQLLIWVAQKLISLRRDIYLPPSNNILAFWYSCCDLKTMPVQLISILEEKHLDMVVVQLTIKEWRQSKTTSKLTVLIWQAQQLKSRCRDIYLLPSINILAISKVGSCCNLHIYQ